MSSMTFPGEVLQRRREELGLTVEDVYRKLRVPCECVEAFESGRLDRLPVDTYAVGFLNTYCEFLQIDPEPWLDALRAKAIAPEKFGPRASGRSLVRRNPWLREVFAWGAVCAVLALSWLAYAVVVQPAADQSVNGVQAETVELEAPDLYPTNR